MKRFVLLAVLAAGGLAVLTAQVDFRGKISGGELPTIAIPVFHGSGAAQNFMATFNQTLRSDIESAGLFKMVPGHDAAAVYPAAAIGLRNSAAGAGKPSPAER